LQAAMFRKIALPLGVGVSTVHRLLAYLMMS
jgi:hypothetical protein